MNEIRNVAVIAHVDHGKTTLVDCLLQHTGMLDRHDRDKVRVMDSNDIEQERGITIFSKIASVQWKGCRINLVDTPGHADFGGEVERVVSMVDAVLLIVDAQEGPMPQTRFVTQKAFARGLKPIVVVNKIDKPAARPDAVTDEVFELFDQLGATNDQLDFPIVYASAIQNISTLTLDDLQEGMGALLDTIIAIAPKPNVDPEGPFQFQVCSLDYNSYVGTMGLGRIQRGRVSSGQRLVQIKDGVQIPAKVLKVMHYEGLDQKEAVEGVAGDIVAIIGIEGVGISDTLCDPDHPEALPQIEVELPTVQISMRVNDSPLAGKEGKFVTSRQLWARLEQECKTNVALRIHETDKANIFLLEGRGELHLSVLFETMRRESYEFAVGKPTVVTKEIDGVLCEPYESLVLDIPVDKQGDVIEMLNNRLGQLQDMQLQGDRYRIVYDIPSRGLFGFRHEFLTLTSGNGIAYHAFSEYKAVSHRTLVDRVLGAMIANQAGVAVGYSLFQLQARGRLFLSPQEVVYEGMIVGLVSRGSDMVVNICKTKQLTNVRASGTDENILLTPPQKITLERAITMICDDELVEITPQSIRLRKIYLKESDRKRHQRSS